MDQRMFTVYVCTIHQQSYISRDAFSGVGVACKTYRKNHSFRLWVVVIHTDVRTTNMLNIYKWLMKKLSNLFSIEASFGCTALVFEVVLVVTFNKGCVFFGSDGITDNT